MRNSCRDSRRNFRIFAGIGLAFALTACITPVPSRGPGSGTVIGKPAGPATRAPSSILSCDDVVMISARNANEGIAKQNNWLERHRPGSRKVQQRLSECGGNKVEILTIQTQNGAREDIYFDVSSYFGAQDKDLDDLLDG